MSATTCNGHSVIMLNGAKVIGNVRRMTKGCVTWRGTKTFNFSKNNRNIPIEFQPKYIFSSEKCSGLRYYLTGNDDVVVVELRLDTH